MFHVLWKRDRMFDQTTWLNNVSLKTVEQEQGARDRKIVNKPPKMSVIILQCTGNATLDVNNRQFQEYIKLHHPLLFSK